MDWGLEYCCGDLTERTARDVWEGPEFTAIRRLLVAKERVVAPCCRCDYWGGGRLGLLPDVGKATQEDYDAAKAYNEASPRVNGRESQAWPFPTRDPFSLF